MANRLPIEARLDEDRGIRWRRSPGGLVQTLTTLLGPEGAWVGWHGLAGPTEVDCEAAAADLSLPHRIHPVDLSEPEYREYYLGFANQIIWPLFHDLHPYCSFEQSYWEAYERVVARFAAATARVANPNDVVWVHDYHLMGVGARLREHGFKGPLGFFLHVPFPAGDIFRRFPNHAELIQSLTAYDRVGFQSVHDARNFVRCLDAIMDGVRVRPVGDGWHLELEGRVVEVGAYPIGIDAEGVEAQARSERVQEIVTRLRRHKRVQYVLGLERLDYTKGIPERLEAFRSALRRYPDLRGRVSLVQHVDPSRQGIRRYAQLRRRIERLVGAINGEFGDLSWTPVHYSFRHLDFDHVLALHQVSDVALVTPVRDGMNLVAKEFCAAHRDGDGVLVLSEFTGAAHQLGDDALVVNPHDVEGTAEAIHRACTMPEAERRRRMTNLRGSVRKDCVQAWAERFLDGLGKTPQSLVLVDPAP